VPDFILSLSLDRTIASSKHPIHQSLHVHQVDSIVMNSELLFECEAI